jgi:phage terminase large subunit GpA-like protein
LEPPAFTNTTLGQRWEEKHATADPEPRLQCRENYAIDAIPWRVLYLTCGVDVQDDRIEYEIVGRRPTKGNETEESWRLENAVLYGHPAQA